MKHYSDMYFELLSKCNRAPYCPYCFYEVDPSTDSHARLPDKVVRSVIRQTAELPIDGIIFSGGEPLISANLEDYIALSIENQKRPFLITNGDLLSERRMGSLVASGLRRMALSLNDFTYPKPDKFKEYHSLRDYTDVAEALQREGISDLTLIAVISKYNILGIREICALGDSMQARVQFKPLYIPPEHPLANQLSLTEVTRAEWGAFRKDTAEWAKQRGKEDYIDLWISAFTENARPKKCNINTFPVRADGSVVPCFHSPHLVVGNVKQESLKEIMEKLEKLDAQIREAQCFRPTRDCLHLFTMQEGYMED